MTKVVVVNGPNLGRLGVRQPDVYGKQDLETLRTLCAQWGSELGLDVEGIYRAVEELAGGTETA